MSKSLQGISIFIVLLFSFFSSHAENIVWGDQAEEGQFSGGIGNWTVQHDFCSNPNGIRDWMWDGEGSVVDGGLVLEDPTINSPTVDNGAMVFLYNTTYTDHRWYHSELISPVIDLGEATNGMYLRFYELVGSLNPCDHSFPPTYVEISTDGGDTWEYWIDANPTLGQQEIYNGERLLLLPNELAGESEVKLKFVFNGDYFFWVIDDVAIVERPEYDLKLDELFFGVPPNAMTPKSQLTPLNFITSFGNYGLMEEEDIQVFVEVADTSSGIVYFRDSLYYEGLAADSIVETAFFDSDFLLPAETREYLGSYKLRGAHEDLLPGDNTLTFRFSVTDTIFAKEFGRTRFVTFGDTSKYAYGNCFYLPHGDGWKAAGISFGMRRPTGGELLEKALSVELYLWVGEPENEDDIISPDELEQVGIGYYDITGDESQNERIEVPLTAFEGGLLLQDDAWYIALVRYDYNTGERFYLNAADRIDYYPNYELGALTGFPNYSTVLQFGNSNNLKLDRFSFGFNIVPTVRLHITNADAIAANMLPLKDLSLTPNPTKGEFRISFATVSPLEAVTIQVVDNLGRTVKSRRYKRIVGKFTDVFRLDDLPDGIYHVVVRSGNEVISRVMVKN